MNDAVGPGEMRIVIRATSVLGSEVAPIPAQVFARSFNNLIGALKSAHKATVGKTRNVSKLYVSHLKMGSNEFGLSGHEFAIATLKSSAFSVYRSEFQKVKDNADLTRANILLGKIYKKGYSIFIQFIGEELPIDSFYMQQTERLRSSLSEDNVGNRLFFSGNTIGSFDGRLGDIDYRGAVWTGHLLLNGSNIQLECVFDKSNGEDSINPFGNKRVSITGRAIYTGLSALPARIEVITIKEIPFATELREIGGSLAAKRFAQWSQSH